MSAPFFYEEREDLEAEVVAFAGGVAVVSSLRSPVGDAPNQDAAALVPRGEREGLLVVADGLGGGRSGGEAARIAVRCIAEAAGGEAGDEGSLRAAILDGIERANRAIREIGVGAATTIVAAELSESGVRSYHVGDSSLLVVGQKGKLKLRTVSHSPVGFAVEAGVIDAAEALHHEERHVVSNVLGADDMRIEVGSARRLALHDTVLLASDGLLDNLHVEEIVERIRKGSVEAAARSLASEARRRMTAPKEGEPSKPDDLSFILFRRDGKP